MTGSPEDLIPIHKEPPPDQKAKKEEHRFKDHTLDKITKVKVLRRIWLLIWFNYVMLFVIVYLEGWTVFGFDLDPWVLVSLIGSTMGSSAVYVIKRSVDYAYSND